MPSYVQSKEHSPPFAGAWQMSRTGLILHCLAQRVVRVVFLCTQLCCSVQFELSFLHCRGCRNVHFLDEARERRR